MTNYLLPELEAAVKVLCATVGFMRDERYIHSCKERQDAARKLAEKPSIHHYLAIDQYDLLSGEICAKEDPEIEVTITLARQRNIAAFSELFPAQRLLNAANEYFGRKIELETVLESHEVPIALSIGNTVNHAGIMAMNPRYVHRGPIRTLGDVLKALGVSSFVDKSEP